MSSLRRSIVGGRITARVLIRSIPQKNFNKLIHRTYSAESFKFSAESNSSKRNIGIAALLCGTFSFALYSYLSPKNPISLDSQTSIKEFPKTPLLPSSSDPKQSITLLTDDEIDKKLHNLEQSYFVNRNKGIFRYDVAQLPSNNPIEDNHVEKVITVQNNANQNNDLYFFGIFDGHGGPFTSAALSKDLVRSVASQLTEVYTKSTSSKKTFDNAIVEGFLKLDKEIVWESFRKLFKNPHDRQNVMGIMPAVSGSCALLSIFNSEDKTLKVAVSGDSRTLIGGIDTDGKNWFVKSLSVDQTGDSKTEVERIRSEHPGEPDVIRRGRILGSLQPSRAFGDYRYKLKDVDGKSLSDLPDYIKLYFRSEPRNFKTPPYVTARPEITTTRIDTNTKFMVMGSDGLFELLSNEEIVSLVVRWMDQYMPSATASARPGRSMKIKDYSEDKDAQRTAFRYLSDKPRLDENDMMLKDSNVATHIIRNALSAGGRPEYVSTLLSIPSPMSRKYRDDLTVTVAFFGESLDTDGTVTLNTAASNVSK